MGLNESFSSAMAQIFLVEHLPALNKSFSIVLQEEQHREILVGSLSSIKAHAFATKSDNPPCTKPLSK